MSAYQWAFTSAGAVLSLWSISWIIRASKTNLPERQAEQDARDRVSQGQGWTDATPPPTISNATLNALARAQAASTLTQAGVVARPADEARGSRK